MALIVVAYDIPDDRRRVRLHTLLLGYGEPVQESLFECELDERQVRLLRAKLRRILAPGDKVRIYPLCAACAARIDDARGRARPPAPEVYIA